MLLKKWVIGEDPFGYGLALANTSIYCKLNKFIEDAGVFFTHWRSK